MRCLGIMHQIIISQSDFNRLENHLNKIDPEHQHRVESFISDIELSIQVEHRVDETLIRSDSISEDVILTALKGKRNALAHDAINFAGSIPISALPKEWYSTSGSSHEIISKCDYDNSDYLFPGELEEPLCA